MPVKHSYEFWCINKDGVKMHEYFSYASTREIKVKKHIEKTYGIDIKECQDFGFRRNHDI